MCTIYKSNFIYNINMFTKILKLRPRGSMDPRIRSPDFIRVYVILCIHEQFYPNKTLEIGQMLAALDK